MKKSIIRSLAVGAALLFATLGLRADSQSFTIPGNTQTNIFPQSLKINSMNVIATNSATLLFYDAPGTTITNIVGAYSNLVQYATNFTYSYTNFFGASNGYIATNVLVTTTNSIPSKTNTYALVFTQAYGSNTTVNFPNLNATFVNGILVTNQSANTIIITPSYSGN